MRFLDWLELNVKPLAVFVTVLAIYIIAGFAIRTHFRALQAQPPALGTESGFVRTYTPGTTITITAPVKAGAEFFEGWRECSKATHRIDGTVFVVCEIGPNPQGKAPNGSRKTD